MSPYIVLLGILSTYCLFLAGAAWVESIIDSRRIRERLEQISRR